MISRFRAFVTMLALVLSMLTEPAGAQGGKLRFGVRPLQPTPTPTGIAEAKLRALVEGARLVRRG